MARFNIANMKRAAMAVVMMLFGVAVHAKESPASSLTGGLRGANGKEPELFGLSEESNKENFIASKGGENDLADRLLEEEEEDAVDPDERTIGLVLAVVNLLCPPMAFLF